MPAWEGGGPAACAAALPPSSRGRRSAQRRAAQGPPCAGSCDRTWLRAWQRPGRPCPHLVALDRLMPGGGRGAGCRPSARLLWGRRAFHAAAAGAARPADATVGPAPRHGCGPAPGPPPGTAAVPPYARRSLACCQSELDDEGRAGFKPPCARRSLACCRGRHVGSLAADCPAYGDRSRPPARLRIVPCLQ